MGPVTSRRGVMGIEAAIIVIAFVVVSTALSLVVLNMGLFTTQKAKTMTGSSIGVASSALEVSGIVVAVGDTTLSNLRVVSIPIRLASGGHSINLKNTTTSIKYMSYTKEYANIYSAALTATTYANDTTAFAAANSLLSDFRKGNPVTAATNAPTNTKAIIYWSIRSNTDTVLDPGEHAHVAIAFQPNDKPAEQDKIRVEVVVRSGAALTVVRYVPPVVASVVDLG